MCRCSGKALFPSDEVSAGHPEGQRGARALLTNHPELFQEGFSQAGAGSGNAAVSQPLRLWCPRGGKGQRCPRSRSRAGLSCSPCSPLGAIPAAVAAQGAGLLLWLCLPCFNSTWELNSPWQPGHSWLQSLSLSRDTAPGAALAFHIPNSTPRTRHDFPSTVPDICIWSPF